MINIETMSYLSTLYTQPHRKYHNINHINDCLAELEGISNPLLSPVERDMVEDAIWWHDAVYNPYSKTNELQSADLYVRHVPSYTNYARIVHATILATAKHLVTQEDYLPLPTQIMLDIDLSGFGKDQMTFARNGMNIRHEYYRTTIKDFLVGRLNFYKALVKRETLYYTEYFHNLYHEKSRENIRWEMHFLETAVEHDEPAIWCNAVENVDGYNP